MAKDKQCGIYKITHIKSGRVYIGQSVDIARRKYEHSKGIGKGHLSRAVSIYGWNEFSFEIVCLCEKDALNFLEAKWISLSGSISPHGFNLTSGGGSNSTVSEETKKKISEAGIGRKQKEETVKKRVEARRKNGTLGGWKIPLDSIIKRNKSRIANAVPLVWSEERRRKKSLQMTGRKATTDQKAIQSERMKGVPRSDAAKAAISAARKGMKFSDEHRRNISLAMRRVNTEKRIHAFAASKGVSL